MIFADDVPSGASSADGFVTITSFSDDDCTGTAAMSFGIATNVCFNSYGSTSYKYYLCAGRYIIKVVHYNIFLDVSDCVMYLYYFDCQTLSETETRLLPNCTTGMPDSYFTSVYASVTVGTEIDIPSDSVLLK